MKEYRDIMEGIITLIFLVVLSFSVLASISFFSYYDIKTDTERTSIMLESVIGYEESLAKYEEVLDEIDKID